MTDPVSPNQSFLTKESQRLLAASLAGFLHDVRGAVGLVTPTFDNPDASLTPSDDWRVDDMRFVFLPGDYASAQIIFSDVNWDGSRSNLSYGERRLDKKLNEQVPAHTKLVLNDTDSTVAVEYEEQVSLTNKVSSSITKGVTLDLKQDAKVSVETKAGAELSGVTAEVKLAAEFGISESKSESSEIGRQQSEEGTKTEALKIAFTAKPRTYYLVKVAKESETLSEDFKIDGIQDATVTIIPGGAPGWKGGALREHCPYDRVVVSGFDGLEQFVNGFDTNYPQMDGYLAKASWIAKQGFAFLFDPANRRIQVEGTTRLSLESNVTYQVQELGNHVPDEYADLPVVNAQSVGV